MDIEKMMWERLAQHQSYADKRGYGPEWARMCEERTPEAADAAQRAAANAAEERAAAAAAWAMHSADAANSAAAADAADVAWAAAMWAADAEEAADAAVEWIEKAEGKNNDT
jgi:hypothetical protein